MVSTAAKPSFGKAIQAGLMAAVVASVVNVVLYLIASAMGLFPSTVLTPMGQPLTVVNVIFISVLSSLVAGAVYGIIARFFANPNRIFYWVAVVVFVLMFFNPFSLRGAPAGMIVSLELMHGVVAAACLYFLTRLAR